MALGVLSGRWTGTARHRLKKNIGKIHGRGHKLYLMFMNEYMKTLKTSGTSLKMDSRDNNSSQRMINIRSIFVLFFFFNLIPPYLCHVHCCSCFLGSCPKVQFFCFQKCHDRYSSNVVQNSPLWQ